MGWALGETASRKSNDQQCDEEYTKEGSKKCWGERSQGQQDAKHYPVEEEMGIML